jgi:predicted cobalt transporter CbtA
MRLVWLAPVMAGLAVALIIVIDLAADDASWRSGLLVAVAGALGATLSGALKLRDQLPRIASMRTFWYAFALQVPIGAVAGLFLWIVLESGLVEIAGQQGADWAVEAAVAFAAGFSEPFVLKTVERITGGGD